MTTDEILNGPMIHDADALLAAIDHIHALGQSAAEDLARAADVPIWCGRYIRGRWETSFTSALCAYLKVSTDDPKQAFCALVFRALGRWWALSGDVDDALDLVYGWERAAERAREMLRHTGGVALAA